MGNKNNWWDALTDESKSAAERRLFLEPLYFKLSKSLYAYFKRRLGSSELAQEGVQRVFDRLLNRFKSPLKKAESEEEIEGYVWRTAKNVLNDLLKQLLSPTVSLEEMTSKISLYQGIWEFEKSQSLQRVRNLIQHLPYNRDRFIMALILCGLSNNQIARLTPWSIDTIRKSVKDSEKTLGYEFLKAPEYHQEPSKNEKLLSYPGNSGHEGMTLANTQLDLDYLSPETSQMLCKTFGLKNIQQLPLFYAPVLVILNAFSGYPILRLCFSPRDDFNPRVFRGVPIFYLDTIPTFRREKIAGKGYQERLWLINAFEFRAWLDDYPRPQGGVKITSWIYDLPERILILKEERESLQFLDKRKALKPALFPFWAQTPG